MCDGNFNLEEELSSPSRAKIFFAMDEYLKIHSNDVDSTLAPSRNTDSSCNSTHTPTSEVAETWPMPPGWREGENGHLGPHLLRLTTLWQAPKLLGACPCGSDNSAPTEAMIDQGELVPLAKLGNWFPNASLGSVLSGQVSQLNRDMRFKVRGSGAAWKVHLEPISNKSFSYHEHVVGVQW
ncbi:hypothetical protein BD779DRAFT_1478410 [Infundibulicybe gibba]|nr:hypothetical protein BD779DRAFT_1478410 [Infundibulicybe gibba]